MSMSMSMSTRAARPGLSLLTAGRRERPVIGWQRGRWGVAPGLGVAFDVAPRGVTVSDHRAARMVSELSLYRSDHSQRQLTIYTIDTTYSTFDY